MDQVEQVGLPALLVAGLVGMLFLAIAIVLFFVVYQKRLMAQQEKLLRLEFEYQKDLVNSSIQIQEVERKRIAADLHDSIGSQLSATKLYLRQLQRNEDPEYQVHVRQEAMDLLEETILNVRQITHDLLPLSLERFGLVAAVEDLADRYNELSEMDVIFEYNEECRFAVEKEVALYRIIQELFNNTFKHAQAKKVELSLQFSESQVRLQYQDDGVGFDYPSRYEEGAKGLGLKSIESRSNFLEAEMVVKSAPEAGLLLHLEVKINPVNP